MNTIKSRSLLILGILAFIGAFHWVYVSWLKPTFGYMGFTYTEAPIETLILAWTLAALPAVWMPMQVSRPSQLISWVLYLAVYIPSIFVPMFAQLRDLDEIRMLMLTLFAGFSITCLPCRLPLWRVPRPAISPTVFWVGFWITTAACIGWVVSVYRGHFQLVAFHEVYESIRFSARDLAKGTGVGYATMALSGSLIPFLMSWALLKRRPIEFAFGALVLVMLYSTAGLKSILTSLAFTPALYVLMHGHRIPFASKLVWLTVAVFVGLNAANLWITDMSRLHMMLSAMVFARTFGDPGLLTAMYDDFFANNPYTYYSQVNGVNWIVPYPYEHSIGVELGYYFSRRIDLNANAHLWCSDGIASLGLPGILIISCLCAAIFWLLDCVSAGHRPVFSATAVSFTALNLSNMSLFTTLLSGGLFLSFLLLYSMPREVEVTETEAEDLDSCDAEQPEFAAVTEPEAALASLTDLQPSRPSNA